MKRLRLRRLVPDEALLERRAGGESLRALARDYGVAHSTLLRWFRRPEVVLELEDVRGRLAERSKAAKAERATERRAEQAVRKQALEDAERDRKLAAWIPPERPSRTPKEAWLDRNEAPRDLSSREMYSTNDRRAAEVVASGGGIAEVIEATGLRTRLNVLQSIDAQVVAEALKHDRRRPPEALQWDAMRLRRLDADSELIRRRAAGETLRGLAEDYEVAHTTLSRFFTRPEVERELRAEQRALKRRPPRKRRPQDTRYRKRMSELAALIRSLSCSQHGKRTRLRQEKGPNGEPLLHVDPCCEQAEEGLHRWVAAQPGLPVTITRLTPTR